MTRALRIASAAAFALLAAGSTARAERVSQLPSTLPAAATAEPGSELQVYLMTMGQGDLVWERFGHNAIGIRDLSAGTDIVYNWGTFSFEQEDFLPRFLRGEMHYWMAPYDAAQTLKAYEQMNRSVTVQELNLTPAQRLEVKAFVEWNQRDENKFYRYDYYLDNCSTRVRDVINRVIGGALHDVAATQLTNMTFREHSLRLTEGMFWAHTGIDFGLGRRTDRRITAWEAMFIPMELQRRLRAIRVRDASGEEAPLVLSEHKRFESTRPPERMEPTTHVVAFLLVGVLVAAALVALGYRVGGPGPSTAVSVLWSLGIGIFGLLLFLLWTVTQHTAAYANQNLFLANPLWLVVAIMVPLARLARGMRNVLLLFVRTCLVLTLVGGLLALTPWGQPSGSIAAFFVPMNIGAYLLVLRVVHLAQQAAARPA
ncbi:MAG: DUF4105 domain-containing protein [Gemmatimonadaceae bacterium]